MNSSIKKIKVVFLILVFVNISLFARELDKPKESWGPLKTESDKENSWKITGTSETSAVYKKNKSTNVSTDTLRQELGLKARGTLGEGKAGIETRGRATDDDRVSSRKAQLLYLRSFYTDDIFDVQVGDVAQTYNPLIFSGTLKGATLTYKQEITKKKHISYSMIGGIQTSSWNDLSNHENNQRDTIAGDIRYQHATAKMIAFTLSAAKDRAGTTSSDINESEAVSMGLQWNWRFNRYLKLKGEAAYTNTDTDTTQNDKKSKFAGKVALYTKPTKTIKSNFKYERYQSEFNSMVGTSTQDKERFENTSTWKISKELRGRMTFKHSRDNLDGDLGETQKIFDTLASLNYRPDFMKRGDIGLRLQQVSKRGRGDNTTQQNIGITFTDRTKDGWTYGASYDYTDLDNSENANSSNNLQTIRTKLGWKRKYDENNNFRASIKADMSFYEENVEDRKRYGGTIDVGWDYKKQFMLDMMVTSKNTDRDLSVDTDYVLYQLISQYKPFKNSTHVLKLNLQRRDNDSGTSDGSYVEEEARLSYAFSF